MINIRFSIVNPWSSLWDAGRCWGGKIAKHKAWECQVYRANVIAEFLIELTHRQDHAGFRFEVSLFTWCFTFTIYDTRHWNYAKESWEIYEE